MESPDLEKYGRFDGSYFNSIEIKLYQLIQEGCASMMELEEYYSLSEAMKLYALFSMRHDVESMRIKEMEKK